MQEVINKITLSAISTLSGLFSSGKLDQNKVVSFMDLHDYFYANRLLVNNESIDIGGNEFHEIADAAEIKINNWLTI